MRIALHYAPRIEVLRVDAVQYVAPEVGIIDVHFVVHLAIFAVIVHVADEEISEILGPISMLLVLLSHFLQIGGVGVLTLGLR